MTRLLAALAVLGTACDGAAGGAPDAAGGGPPDGGLDQGGDGGVASPRTIELTLTNRPNNASVFSFVVAYQDGSAAWKLAPAPTGNTYTFEVTAPSYGVAYTCIGSVAGGNTTPVQLRTVTSAHFAIAERTQVTLEVPSRCSDRVQNTVALSGQITNRPLGGVMLVQYGARTVLASTQSGFFTMQVPAGTRDLIALHAVPQGNGDFLVDESVTIRDLVVNGPTTKSIDFNNAQATDEYDVDVSADAPRVVTTTTLYTANGTQGTITRLDDAWATNALPSSQRRATDVYDVSISVSRFRRNETVTRASSTPGPHVYAEPAPLGDVASTVVTTTPYPTVETTWPAYADAVGYTWTASQDDTCDGFSQSCTTVWTAYLSPGVTGAAPAYRMPDLSSVAGWKPAFELDDSSTIVGSVTATRSTAGPDDFPTGIPASGTQRVFVRTDYGIAP